MPILTGLGQPVTAFSFDPDGALMARASDGSLWRAYTEIDPIQHTVEIGSAYFEGVRFDATYSFSQPDPDHLVLTPTSNLSAAQGVVTLTRLPVPSRYPLLDQKFHWVNEWALER